MRHEFAIAALFLSFAVPSVYPSASADLKYQYKKQDEKSLKRFNGRPWIELLTTCAVVGPLQVELAKATSPDDPKVKENMVEWLAQSHLLENSAKSRVIVDRGLSSDDAVKLVDAELQKQRRKVGSYKASGVDGLMSFMQLSVDCDGLVEIYKSTF